MNNIRYAKQKFEEQKQQRWSKQLMNKNIQVTAQIDEQKQQRDINSRTNTYEWTKQWRTKTYNWTITCDGQTKNENNDEQKQHSENKFDEQKQQSENKRWRTKTAKWKKKNDEQQHISDTEMMNKHS